MTTSESKGQFFTKRIDSNRELECSTVKPSTVVGRAFPVACPTIWNVRLWISVTAGRGIFSTGAACVHRISNSCPWCNRPASYRSLWTNCCRIEPRSRTFALRTSAPGHLFPPKITTAPIDCLFLHSFISPQNVIAKNRIETGLN